MPADLSPIDLAKCAAARRAARLVEPGMRLGLGTGSTAAWLVRALGDRVRDEGLTLRGVPTSERTAELAREVGIEVTTLDEVGWLDLAIDGADEVDPELNLIKGGGGALLREKIVAAAAERVVIIADASKRVERLGAFPLPVEVIPFGLQATRTLIEETLLGLDLGARGLALRMAGPRPFVTDEGNHIIDLHLLRIGQARQLGLLLNQIPGVVENGLFLDLCDALVIGHPDGRVELRDQASGAVEEGREQLPGAAPEPRPAGRADNIFTDVTD
jgi:ribose 5-phosphate isomerase A